MTLNKGTKIAAEKRRALIASLLARNPRITQRAIQDMLATGNGGNPLIVNPNTGKPYELGTINADIKEIRQGYRDKAAQEGEVWIGELLSRYEEIYQQALKGVDLGNANRATDSIAKLLGVIIEKHDHTTGGESLNAVNDIRQKLLADVARRRASDDADTTE